MKLGMPFSGRDRQAAWAAKHKTILVNTHKIQTVVVLTLLGKPKVPYGQ